MGPGVDGTDDARVISSPSSVGIRSKCIPVSCRRRTNFPHDVMEGGYGSHHAGRKELITVATLLGVRTENSHWKESQDAACGGHSITDSAGTGVRDEEECRYP